MKNVAVFFGGESVEHEVSVITGTLTLNSVDGERYNAIPVFVDRSGKWWTGEILREIDKYKSLDYKKLKKVTLFSGDNTLYLVNGKKIKPLFPLACAVNCMHGERGEDGSLAGVLTLSKIPLASPSIFPSALSMSKSFTKIALKGLGVRTLPYALATSILDAESVETRLGYPLIVKPDNGGSSIGITVAKNRRELEKAISVALRYGVRAIVEPLLEDFVEINCACYKVGQKIVVSECEKPLSRGTILSFDDKYSTGERVFPADIDKRCADKIKAITTSTYQKLGFDGVVRIDYMLKDNKIYLNEINSVPGSLAYYLFVKTLKEYTGMLTQLIDDAIVRGARDSTFTKNFSSGILSATGSKGAKRLKKG